MGLLVEYTDLTYQNWWVKWNDMISDTNFTTSTNE